MPGDIEKFIERWRHADGNEKANYQLFLTDLCKALDLPEPDPSAADTENNAYVFERRVDIRHPDGNISRGYIDLYRRDAFVLEAKQTGKDLGSQGWDKAMLAAHNQADQYVRALPIDEGRPPFIVVTDVGRSLELYSEFSRSGGTYVPFPDPSSHRIKLEDLRDADVRERLRLLWLSPDALDPTKHSARVTREISDKLAELARSLERDGYEVERVAHFLKRCLFTMFCEDVELLPKNSYTGLLVKLKEHPEHFVNSMRNLWEVMNNGGYEGQLMVELQRFNGGLFRNIEPIQLSRDQIELLIQAGRADWRHVEPAIFGTLLERALDPRERHKLGAHYTPRAYVERLVIPTVVEPLRREWKTAQVAAETWLQQEKPEKAVNELREFHYRLCQIRVLDPACGSGNFLYVALEHLKRLEGEVLNTIRDLSAGQQTFDTEGLTVDPHQFLGLEVNPRAAAIAEMVLWIGYLQWHYRLYGKLSLPEPILRDFRNIEHRDALIDYDGREPVFDENGSAKTIWDGVSYKKSITTGELVPDEAQRVPIYSYLNPRKVDWPKSNFIIGNPPFIGEKRMRDALGDGYVDAVREAYSELPACDFVMYWWHKAAELLDLQQIQQFGFITTNSITQSKNRAITQPFLEKSLSLRFAIPDHPWVDSTDGAAVRIAMTVCEKAPAVGYLLRLRSERVSEGEAREVEFEERRGAIFADLSIGAPLLDAEPLTSNNGIVFQGVKLVGDGFLLGPEQRDHWLQQNRAWAPFLPQLVSGTDITKRREPRYCIDFFGLEADEAKKRFPPGFQQLVDSVKPHRENNKDRFFRERWWLFGRGRGEMRQAISALPRYIATSEVSKHRYFVFLDSDETLADGSCAVVAVEDAFFLGCLSSRLHIRWALAQGGRMGMGNDPRWQNGPCFMNFPFPDADQSSNTGRIRDLAEQIDTHRKQQQMMYGALTLTDIYNVLEKLRGGGELTEKERLVHKQGLVTLLREMHDDLDRVVFAAYGWQDIADVLVGRPGATTPLPDKPTDQAEAEEELLTRLVALNRERAAEEAQGKVRWLRPELQAPESVQVVQELKVGERSTSENTITSAKLSWPKDIPSQVEVVRRILEIGPQTTEAIATHFKRKPEKGVSQVLAALQALGHVKRDSNRWYAAP